MIDKSLIKNIAVLILSFILSLALQNKQGNTVGSFFLKLSEDTCFHLHHWISSIILIIFLKYVAKPFPHKDDLIATIAGFGLAGFTYSDRFHCIKPTIKHM